MLNSAEEFVRLRTSSNKDDYLRAATESATEAVWLEVIDNFPEMRKWVAHNKTVPLSVLHILAKDPDANVRFSVAMKRKLDDCLFNFLCQDSDSGVRHAIACNAKTPTKYLEVLLEDEFDFVRNAARSRLSSRFA